MGFTPNVSTFNHLLKIVPLVRDNVESKWQMIEDLLKQMASMKVKPNVLTMNAVLQTLGTIPITKVATDLALKTWAEFDSIGVESSMATYFHILNIFYKPGNYSQISVSTNYSLSLRNQLGDI